MNKKELLALAYNHQIPDRKIEALYAVRASLEIINNSKLLYLSIYKAKRNTGIPEYKVFMKEEEYISLVLQKDGSYKWSKASLEYLLGYCGYLTRKTECVSEADRGAIARFLGHDVSEGHEVNFLESHQQMLMNINLKKKHDRITDKIDEVMRKVPDLPKDFDEWVYKVPFKKSRYIFYKRNGSKIDCFCAECKSEITIKEDKKTKEAIKHNNPGKCPVCGANVIYKAIGKSKKLNDYEYFTVIQKIEDDLVVRYFYGYKDYRFDYKKPRLTYRESIRQITNNKSLEIKKYEYTYFLTTGVIRWCNDNGRFYPRDSYLYTRNLKSVLKDSPWKYSCIYEYAKKVGAFPVDAYLEEYIKHPAIEYFVKLKLYNLVKSNIKSYSYYRWKPLDMTGKNITEIMKLGKEDIFTMQRLNLGSNGLELLQALAKKKKPLSDSYIKFVLGSLDTQNFIKIINYTSTIKAVNYIKKQSADDYAVKDVLIDWVDYIGQCKELKFDLNNSFVLFPRKLREKHEEYIILTRAKGLEKYNTGLEKAFKLLEREYSFSDKSYSIRPVSSVEEIIREGHCLRHCVAGESYIKGIVTGKIAIMVIREVDKPEKPYYTLELGLNNELYIKQCRGFKNESTVDKVKRFIEKWLKKIKAKKMKKVG